jgi:hypothetical protein
MAFGRRKVQAAVGTATAADVLTGYTFSSAVAGIGVAGTMPNNGSPTLQPGQTLAAGYYSGGQAAAPGSGSQSWTTPGTYTWTVPSGVTRIVAVISGAGGGGAGGISSNGGGGGGQGAIVMVLIPVVPGGIVSGTIGAGGVGGAAGTSGGNGQSSTLTYQGQTLTAPGGGGGNAGGAGGVYAQAVSATIPSTWLILAYPTDGLTGNDPPIKNTQDNNNGANGGTGQFCPFPGIPSAGGSGGTSSAPTGGGGSGAGAGGGGGYENNAGGNGAPGAVYIFW